MQMGRTLLTSPKQFVDRWLRHANASRQFRLAKPSRIHPLLNPFADYHAMPIITLGIDTHERVRLARL